EVRGEKNYLAGAAGVGAGLLPPAPPVGAGVGTSGAGAGALCAVPAAARMLYLFATIFSTIPSSRKTPKTMLVAQVSTSPVLDPNAVFPPPPPNAPDNPPPRPFWISTSRIRK